MSEKIDLSSMTAEQLSVMLSHTDLVKVLPEDINGWIEEGLSTDFKKNISLIDLLAWMNSKIEQRSFQ